MISNYYSQIELIKLGFKRLGRNVLISRKASLYSPEEMEIGDNVRIDDFCILSGKIVLGNYIHIAAFSALFGSDVGIFMDDFSGVSSRCSVYSVSDDYSGMAMTNPMIPNEFRNVNKSEIFIRKHALVGATSILLPGADTGVGSSFGSFSLLTKKYNDWGVYCGIPVKRIKDRDQNLLELESKFLKCQKD